MSVSRNRKKKSNQSNDKPKTAHPMCIHKLFELQFNNCRKCGKARDKFEYNELPREEQLHWEESGVYESIDFILYCPSCNEYSALLKTDEF